MNTNVKQVLHADKSTRKLLAATLTQAFSDDLLFEFAFANTPEQAKHDAMNEYFDFALGLGERSGGVFTTSDGQGVAIWLPQASFPPEPPESLDVNVEPIVVERFAAHEHTPESIIAAHGQNFGYLWLLAVSPDARGRGYARKLIDAVMAKTAESGKKECWLSTENPDNKAFYLHHGFQLFAEKISDAGITTTVFVKPIK